MRVVFEKCSPSGVVSAPPSKSIAHRYLICAFLSGEKCRIDNIAYSKDIEATINCLTALGGRFDTRKNSVEAYRGSDTAGELDCNESGSTLRFLIPYAMTLNRETVFKGSKKLMERPLSVYEEIAKENGFLFEKGEGCLKVKGNLKGGIFNVRGDISSQFISGLMFVLPNLENDSVIKVSEPFESKSYVYLTVQALETFGVDVKIRNNEIYIKGGQKFKAADVEVEGDCSNAAYLDCFEGIEVEGLNENTRQGDRVFKKLFEVLDKNEEAIDLKDCPDLGPVLFAYAAAHGGGRFKNCQRLIIKESNRIEAMRTELEKFGINLSYDNGEVAVENKGPERPEKPLCSHNDHRIVMALSYLLCRTGGCIENAEAVSKSFPDYFDVLRKCGAKFNMEEIKQ